MTDDRWSHVKDVFNEAIELDPDRWDTFLAQRCADDPCVREQVASLLRSHQAAGSFIERPAGVWWGLSIE